MRIISGTLKGKSINFLKNSKTRPLKDNVKENIFNILRHSNQNNSVIEDSNILDLYAGGGSFGIECISRGADKVTFIEQDINAAKILKDNLLKLSISDKSKIYIDKIENFLKKDIREKFNVFFFDPPFKDLAYLKNLQFIKKKNIFKRNHIIVIHREEKSKDNFKNIIDIIKTKKYGRSKIIFGVFN